MSYTWKQTEHDKTNGLERHFFTENLAVPGDSGLAYVVVTRCTDKKGNPIPSGKKRCYLLQLYRADDPEGLRPENSHYSSLEEAKTLGESLLTLDREPLKEEA